MAANYCRREITVNEAGETRFCMKAITAVNALDWCKDCTAERLPFWPKNDAPTAQEPAQCSPL